MNSTKLVFMLPAIAVSLFIPVIAAAQSKKDLAQIQARLSTEIRYSLVMLSNYNLFDNLEFEISGADTVVLLGQVTRPTLKSDAERVVRGIDGVLKVINKIEVLPISPGDEKMRIAVYRAIYSTPGLDVYAIRAVPPIHILVNNGSIALVGVVANEMEKDLAEAAAKEVPGSFGVVNKLRVEYK